jgi:3-oxoacyl-[acyl-carrier protein] reductase
MFDLTGRVAVVTGASRGLGRQDALTLAHQGADVVITDVLVEDDPDLQKTAEAQGSMLAQVAVSQGWVHSNSTAEEIRKMGRRSLAIKMDVTNREQIRDVFKKVKDEFGKIDILINNAATLDHAAQIPNQSYELWDRDVRVNLTGAFNCTKEVWPYLMEQKWGRLIFMSSVAGTLGGFGQASYSATKAGLIGLAKTAALEGGRHGITANAIVPGIILSEAGAAAAGGNPLYERFKNRTVFKRFGEPSNIAATIGFLCSEEAGYITGTTIEVAGGIPLFTA